jgi:hypothetical protein
MALYGKEDVKYPPFYPKEEGADYKIAASVSNEFSGPSFPSHNSKAQAPFIQNYVDSRDTFAGPVHPHNFKERNPYPNSGVGRSDGAIRESGTDFQINSITTSRDEETGSPYPYNPKDQVPYFQNYPYPYPMMPREKEYAGSAYPYNAKEQVPYFQNYPYPMMPREKEYAGSAYPYKSKEHAAYFQHYAMAPRERQHVPVPQHIADDPGAPYYYSMVPGMNDSAAQFFYNSMPLRVGDDRGGRLPMPMPMPIKEESAPFQNNVVTSSSRECEAGVDAPVYHEGSSRYTANEAKESERMSIVVQGPSKLTSFPSEWAGGSSNYFAGKIGK